MLVAHAIMVFVLFSMADAASNATTTNSDLEYCYQCNGGDCKHLKDKCTTDETNCYMMTLKTVNRTMSYEAGCTNIKCDASEGKQELCQGKQGNNTTCNVIGCCEEDFCNDIDDILGTSASNAIAHMDKILFPLMTFIGVKLLAHE